jgi:hypothetical protein
MRLPAHGQHEDDARSSGGGRASIAALAPAGLGGQDGRHEFSS